MKRDKNEENLQGMSAKAVLIKLYERLMTAAQLCTFGCLNAKYHVEVFFRGFTPSRFA